MTNIQKDLSEGSRTQKDSAMHPHIYLKKNLDELFIERDSKRHKLTYHGPFQLRTARVDNAIAYPFIFELFMLGYKVLHCPIFKIQLKRQAGTRRYNEIH